MSRPDLANDGTYSILWTRSTPDLLEIAAFFADVITLDSGYIRHREIQAGLSPDGRRWAGDVGERFAKDLLRPTGDFSVCVARSEHHEIEAAAMVRWIHSERCGYAVLEDLAVAPPARGRGMGAAVIAFVEEEARARDCSWVFLESGTRDTRPHSVLERAGYSAVSQVFAKRLGR